MKGTTFYILLWDQWDSNKHGRGPGKLYRKNPVQRQPCWHPWLTETENSNIKNLRYDVFLEVIWVQPLSHHLRILTVDANSVPGFKRFIENLSAPNSEAFKANHNAHSIHVWCIHIPLRIQVCPKKGINPTILLWG